MTYQTCIYGEGKKLIKENNYRIDISMNRSKKVNELSSSFRLFLWLLKYLV